MAGGGELFASRREYMEEIGTLRANQEAMAARIRELEDMMTAVTMALTMESGHDTNLTISVRTGSDNDDKPTTPIVRSAHKTIGHPSFQGFKPDTQPSA